jgi:predicted  nucleic acid-binding Zn-ribbon protein
MAQHHSPTQGHPLVHHLLRLPEESTDNASRISQLEEELEVVRGEKESLGNQYRALLGKLTTMRQSLGDKLREDAVSPIMMHLDRS